MAILASKTELGGVVGDTFTDALGNNFILTRVDADGQYVWREFILSGAPLSESSQTLGGFRQIDADGNSFAITNVLTHQVNSSNHIVTAQNFWRAQHPNTSSFTVQGSGLSLNFGAGTDLLINNNTGVSGQQLTSQGDNNPPIWGAASDERMKSDIENVDNFTEQLSGITAKKYKYGNNDFYQIGVIAQEVEKSSPYLVNKQEANGFDDFRTVDYNAITALLVEEVKALRAEIEYIKSNRIS